MPVNGVSNNRSKLNRRTVLQGAAAALAAPSAFGIRSAAAQSGGRSLKVLTIEPHHFADGWHAASEPESGDGTFKRAIWGIAQNWKERHPDVEVQFEEVAWDQVTPAVILASQSGTESDVVQVNDLNIPKLARGGFLLPMDQFSDQWDDYNQQLLRGVASYDGAIYGAPWTTDCRHELYWKSDFAAAGLSDPASTWDEFVEQLKAIKSTGIENPYSFWAGNSVHTPTQSLLSQLWMLGGDVLDADGRAVLNTPEMHEVFGFYNRLMNEEQVSSPDLIAIFDGGAYADQILSHKVAVSKNGAWDWWRAVAAGHGDSIGYFRTPRPNADAPDATLSGFWGFELPARTGIDDAQQELAAEFALHVTSAESQAIVVEHTEGRLPTRPSVLDSPQVRAKDDAWRFQGAYAAEAGRGMPAAADSGLLFDQMQTAFQRFLTGQRSAEDALSAAESRYNSQVT